MSIYLDNKARRDAILKFKLSCNKFCRFTCIGGLSQGHLSRFLSLIQLIFITARRSVASRAGIVIAHGTGGRVGGRVGENNNVPLDAGSPKLAQRFVSTPSSILPEMMSLSTSGRLQPFCKCCKFEPGSKSHERFS